MKTTVEKFQTARAAASSVTVQYPPEGSGVLTIQRREDGYQEGARHARLRAGALLREAYLALATAVEDGQAGVVEYAQAHVLPPIYERESSASRVAHILRDIAPAPDPGY